MEGSESMMIKRITLTVILAAFLCCDIASTQQEPSPFKLGEIQVASSPQKSSRWIIPAQTQVVDFDVSPLGPELAILLRDSNGVFSVAFWKIGTDAPASSWTLQSQFQPRSLAWHPAARCLFLAGTRDSQYEILRVDSNNGKWQPKTIYASIREIRRLVPGPRPFRPNTDTPAVPVYRLFFGEMTADKAFAVMSVTEEGKTKYQAIGPKSGLDKTAEFPPSEIVSDWALPVSFHPSGNLLLWEDKAHKFNKAGYGNFWEKSTALLSDQLSGGSVTVTPNGSNLIHWRPAIPGVELLFQQGAKRNVQAADFAFLSTPSSVPDGKGLVGLTKLPEGTGLAYVPLEVPLSDVVNAWMFMESPTDENLFTKNEGLFRDLKDDQLYSLYDSEAYQCGGYSSQTPTRPYLVTTDIFWELFASAYEGMFIIKERYEAMPAFWSFVESARNSLQSANPRGMWAQVFDVLAKLRNAGGRQEPEVSMIQAADGSKYSTVLKMDFNYGDLKPRGHYSSSPELAGYFRAFRYLTAAVDQIDDVKDLQSLPRNVNSKALEWMRTYEPFIAPPRGPVIWQKDKFVPPTYARHTLSKLRAFPLSWGFDNEVLLSTVFHENWPEAERIEGPGGFRIMPSGLDLADALGSKSARTLLSEQFGKYPPLKEVLNKLQGRFKSEAEQGTGDLSLYHQWINALGKQWAEDVVDTAGKQDQIWRAKRLQTGLASWTTLRHTTVLVNERTAAECGEGGFEEILLRPPRGAVEPDPAAFEAIAGLFDAADKLVGNQIGSPQSLIPSDSSMRETLRTGIKKRLSEVAQKARLFQKIADKEVRGIPLTNEDYEEILYVGRVAEHNFLVFKSLANKDLALSNPDPVSKIVDISGGTNDVKQYLLSAVGRPMEWDWIVPFYGRREIVKGSIYSYYEFLWPKPMTDQEWRTMLAPDASKNKSMDVTNRPAFNGRPSWVSRFVSGMNLSCPARAPF
jgi:hypothetical protein